MSVSYCLIFYCFGDCKIFVHNEAHVSYIAASHTPFSAVTARTFLAGTLFSLIVAMTTTKQLMFP